MPKPPLKWMVTANFTADGSVAYARADKTFSGSLSDAALYDTKEAAEEMRQVALATERIVSDPYLTEVAEGARGLDVLTTRERIRSQGPTIRYGRRS